MSLEQQLAGLNSNLSDINTQLTRIADAMDAADGTTTTVVKPATEAVAKVVEAAGEVLEKEEAKEAPAKDAEPTLQELKQEAIDLGAERDSVINLRKKERVQEIIDNLKAEAEDHAAAEEEAEQEEEQEQAKEPAAELDIPALRDKLKAVAKEHGMDAAQGVLKEFGVTKITDLEEQDFEEFSDRCDVLLGGEDGDDIFG